MEPLSLLWVLNVHVLHADGSAVGVAKDLVDFAELHLRLSTEASGFELAVEIPETQVMSEDV